MLICLLPLAELEAKWIDSWSQTDMDLTAIDSWPSKSENLSDVLEQPPYTEATIIILLFISILLLAAPTLLINATLSVAFFKSGQHKKPLGILHASLLVEILLNKLLLSIVFCIYYPPALRHCNCSPTLSAMYQSSRPLILSFRSIVYASIALCQLLIITDKKKYVNHKTMCGCVAFAIGVGAIFATESAVLTNLNDERLGCTDFCPGQNFQATFNFSARTIVTVSYIVLAWLPSLVILLISTTWSCVVFKKRYTGGDDQLNRRLISLPVILPTGFILATVFILLLRRLVLIIIQSYEVRFAQYWLFLSGAVISLLDEIIDGVIYQLILVYLNPQLYKIWKDLFHRHSNQVHPQIWHSYVAQAAITCKLSFILAWYRKIYLIST